MKRDRTPRTFAGLGELTAYAIKCGNYRFSDSTIMPESELIAGRYFIESWQPIDAGAPRSYRVMTLDSTQDSIHMIYRVLNDDFATRRQARDALSHFLGVPTR